MNNLGYLYEYGQGVDRNLKESARWYKAAAELNDAKGQANYGVMCLEGSVAVPPDLVEAYRWIKLSSLQGDAIGKKHLMDCEDGAWSITPDQIRQGEALVAEFLARQRQNRH